MSTWTKPFTNWSTSHTSPTAEKKRSSDEQLHHDRILAWIVLAVFVIFTALLFWLGAASGPHEAPDLWFMMP